MNHFKFLLLAIVLSWSLLCWSSVCDNVQGVPQEPKDETSLHGKNLPDHVNTNLEGKDASAHEKSKVVDIPEESQKSIPKPDEIIADFSDSLRKMRRKEVSDSNSKKKFLIVNPSPQIVTKRKLERETKKSAQNHVNIDQDKEENTKLDPPSAIVNEESLPLVTTLKETSPVPLEGSLGSQNASPSGSMDLTSPRENLTPSSEESVIPVHVQHPPPHEEMPLFDDWKKMMLAEQEKGGHKIPMPDPLGNKPASQKRRRNYASYECGAKIVASNSEAEGTSRILTEVSDEYMLNPCQAKIWFVIELCESVQASQIEIANFELFSSCPKDFSVSSSDNFPSREWVPLGVFMATEQRMIQSFQLKQEGYGKFIKIELLGHYGKEYYCPLSVVRIFGQSMVDEYEEMEKLSNPPVMSDDDLDRLDLPVEDKGGTNLFGSATDAVYNIVKKAAQALLPQTADGEASVQDQCKMNDSDCKQENKTINITKEESPPELLSSASSIRRTLFHHLRHCEQCVKVSRPSYHSVSEPHCRFFQAALGPVLFNSICEWFRDHHLITVIHHQLPESNREENKSSIITKPTSPPPSVINVIIEANQTGSYDLTTSTQDLKQSVDTKTEDINVELTPSTTAPKVVSSTSDIKPTQTQSIVEDSSLSLEISEEPIVTQYSGDVVDVHSTDMLTLSSPVLTQVGSDEMLSPTITTVVEVTVVANETKGTLPLEKLDGDKIATDAAVSSIPPSQIDIMSDDFNEERMTDSSSKLETTTMSTIMTSQKESVFVRMNNRIKALELNMSLSSQYLQELSQRYRRQMEEMQRSFNRTIGTLNDTAKKAAERDMKQQEVIRALQSDVANLSILVDQLVTERSSVLRHMLEVHIFLMVAEAIIMITVMSLCIRRISSVVSVLPQSAQNHASVVISPRKRRSSSDCSPTLVEPKMQKRSSSEEVLQKDKEMLILEPNHVVVPVSITSKGKKKNRKKKGLQRCASNPSITPRKENLHKKEHSKETSAAGIIFSPVDNVAKRMEPSKTIDNTCENCCKDTHINCNVKKAANFKESKRCSVPLKNLTNGDLERPSDIIDDEQDKQNLGLKKVLVLQKRDSI